MQTYPPRLTNQVIAEIGMTGWVSEPFFCLVQKLPPTFSTYPPLRPGGGGDTSCGPPGRTQCPWKSKKSTRRVLYATIYSIHSYSY